MPEAAPQVVTPPVAQTAPQEAKAAEPSPSVAKETGEQPKPQEEAKPKDPLVSDAAKVMADAKAKKDQERQTLALQKARRVEASAREAEQRVKAREAELAKKEAELQKAAQYDKMAQLAQQDPLEFMKAAGISQQQILDRMVKGDKRTPEEIAQSIVDKALADRDARAKADAETKAKQEAEAVAKANQEAISNSLKELGELIKKDSDRYEYCGQRPDAAAQAMRVIEAYYAQSAKTGRAELLPFDEALDAVEADFEKKDEEFRANSKKLKAKAEAAAAAEKAKQEAEAKAKAATSGNTKGRPRTLYRDAEPKKPDVVVATSTEGQPQKPEPFQDLSRARNRRALAKEFQERLAKRDA
jgi:hypothetical protein